MFGHFELRIGDSSISDSSNRAHQLWNLLEYLIVFRAQEVTLIQLIDILWGEEEIDNPVNALKNLVYRVRMLLTSGGLPAYAKNIILYQNGSYRLNPSYDYDVDIEKFEALCIEASDSSLSPDKRIGLYQEALALYRGDCLPKSAFEKWIIPLSSYYHSLYIKTVCTVTELLKEQNRHTEIIKLCERAIVIDKFEESFRRALIYSLVKLERQNEALAQYEQVTDLFYTELGVRPSDELRHLYREIIKTVSHVETDLEMIKEDLQESLNTDGAFYCDYEIFKNMYRLEARSAERTGQSIFLGLLTLTALDGGIPSLKMMNYAMERLWEATHFSLRRSDVFARFSATQYVLMLPTLTLENGQMVLNRILARFKRENPAIRCKISSRLMPLDPVI